MHVKCEIHNRIGHRHETSPYLDRGIHRSRWPDPDARCPFLSGLRPRLYLPLKHVQFEKETDVDNEEFDMNDRKMLPSWWIIPGTILGCAVWAVIITVIF